MDPDLAMTAGVVICGLATVSFISALSDRRPPRVAFASAAAGVGLMGFAFITAPEGFAISDIPHALIRVVARFWP